jgi:hypothetical protein
MIAYRYFRRLKRLEAEALAEATVTVTMDDITDGECYPGGFEGDQVLRFSGNASRVTAARFPFFCAAVFSAGRDGARPSM